MSKSIDLVNDYFEKESVCAVVLGAWYTQEKDYILVNEYGTLYVLKVDHDGHIYNDRNEVVFTCKTEG